MPTWGLIKPVSLPKITTESMESLEQAEVSYFYHLA